MKSFVPSVSVTATLFYRCQGSWSCQSKEVVGKTAAQPVLGGHCLASRRHLCCCISGVSSASPLLLLYGPRRLESLSPLGPTPLPCRSVHSPEDILDSRRLPPSASPSTEDTCSLHKPEQALLDLAPFAGPCSVGGGCSLMLVCLQSQIALDGSWGKAWVVREGS